VIVNGGLGPTIDDLTAEVLAEVAGVPLAEHAEALAHLTQWCAGRGLELNEANRKQALLPAGLRAAAQPGRQRVGVLPAGRRLPGAVHAGRPR
jgi:nicotinamide-nucleotide amidase